MPRKTKIRQNLTGGTGEPSAPATRVDAKVAKSAARRTEQKAKKKPARKKRQITGTAKPRSRVEATQVLAPTDEEIRIRAYFISERRRRFALSGDANSDWLEAKRQLLSESARR